MYKKNYHLRALLGILMAGAVYQPAQAQYVKKQADEKALLYNYAKATSLYDKAYNKKATAEAARGAAESYRHMNDYVNAEPWYAKLVAMPEHTAEDEKHYAAILMNNSKYEEAKVVLDSFLTKMPGDKLGESMRQGCDSAVKWLAAPVRGGFQDLQAINSEWSDWSTEFNNGKVIFASDRPYDSLRHESFLGNNYIRKSYYSWTGNSYLHLYEANAYDSSSIRPLDRIVNGDYHSASASYTADGSKMYYAVTNLASKGRSFLGKDEPYTLNIEIMERRWDTAAGNWKLSVMFPYNEIFHYPVGDPFIMPDGKTIYFVADYGDKGNGGTDIYYSTLDENGQWQAPVNMGSEINTPGNERTPVLDKKGVLYFATDGRPGMGGLDIFKAVKANGAWAITNMRPPVNSAQDDFAPVFSPDEFFWFSSNRPDGKGSDDIYSFKAFRILVFSLSGKATDKKTGLPLSNATITLKNNETGKPSEVITDEAGNYRFQLDSLSSYGLAAVRNGYNGVTGLPVTTKGLEESQELHQDIVMEQPKPEVKVEPAAPEAPELEVNKHFKLENVYFDVAKSNITPKAKPELDKLAALLNDNPTWKVEIATHTDSRSSASYNLKLSQQRAESIVKYLITKGVGKARLVAKGYGETRLLNRCADGVKCTEAEHQENRRSEFTILNK